MKFAALGSLLAVLWTAGCSTASKPTPAVPPARAGVEGSWSGQEVTPGHEGQASLSFTGQTMQFHGPSADDWCKGTFTLDENTRPRQMVCIFTDGPNQDMVGQKIGVIYKVEGETLTITGGGPGDTNFPTAFDAPGYREFVMKRN